MNEKSLVFVTEEAGAAGLSVEQFVVQTLGTIPAATLAAYESVDPELTQQENDVITVYNFLQGSIEAENNAVATQETKVATTKRSAAASLSAVKPALTDRETEAVNEVFKQDATRMYERSQATRIVNFLVQKDKQSVIYKHIKFVSLKDKAESLIKQMKDHAADLVDDAENKKVYTELLQKLEKGEYDFPIHINDASRKFEGITITLPGKGNKVETMILPQSEIAAFLASEVLGMIPSNNGLGVILKGMKGVTKKGSAGVGEEHIPVPVLKYDGKSTSIKEDKNLEVTTVVKTGKTDKATGSLPIAPMYRVYVKDANGQYKTNKKGERMTKPIRFRGKTEELPVFERKPEFKSHLGEISVGTHIPSVLTKEQIQEQVKNAVDLFRLQGLTMVTASEAIAKVKEAVEAAKADDVAAKNELAL